MKKGILITIAVVGVIALAAAGTFVAVSSGMFHEEANGLILYGTEQQISADKELEASDTEYCYQTQVKIAGEDLMIIREKDMKEFCKKQLVNQINAEDQCEPVSEVESAEETPVYYAKDAKTSVNIAGNELKATAGKDLIIGTGRMLDRGYLMVSDSLYEELTGDETEMLVLGLNKAADKEIERCQFEQVQLIDIQ